MHQILDHGIDSRLSGFNRRFQQRRVAWVTSCDTLSVGWQLVRYGGLKVHYTPQLPIFKRLTIDLACLELSVRFGLLKFIRYSSATFQIHLLQKIGIIIHTVEIITPISLGTPRKSHPSTQEPAALVSDIADLPDAIESHGSSDGHGTQTDVADFSESDIHFVEVVELTDTLRIEELLSLHFHADRGIPAWDPQDRLDRVTWWHENGYSRAKEAISKVKALEIWDNQFDGRRIRVPSLESIRKSELPELIPTVKFVFKFPGTFIPGITVDDARILQGKRYDDCYAGACFPGDLSDDDL
ncbi:uncharacterized protein CTRU02_212425 [Colletotrichum truncatum]|uniref:Uncharacterized protein n=1 Tax=Colletotrichum truncatum TaxID=5467 RepID=A0ACC3YNQ2_COLTU|nr:uncharacterized protein CTRU02_08703 [Colletotrichum truncatum]KAF6789456.1 hypothetical protein CTRU02_08703 [Colletotrichum truncatum]